ncbi:PD40 domain-containing protein [Chitinophaga pendula]|uniref:tetratricopeptide repeat protein n=1 Tax=Chitinophaga TaxID=79328 RepID=UPI000BB087CA|nr:MULTISPECIES: tetratricopeptide repeat protein [Chitinophaga]ASZ13191.1 hypothetical protein CK934_20605 [Chitinophaga sp. MD30]UCJ09189.1 PD40 domain-containing protein [Chitinophaga pendula]
MKYMFRITFLWLLVPVLLSGQQRYLLSQGDRAYQSLQYVAAIPFYEKALQKDSLRSDALSKLADCYDRTQQYTPALDCYGRLIQLDTTAHAELRYAQLLAMHSRYVEAAAQYRHWLTRYGHDPLITATAALYERGMDSLYLDTLQARTVLLNINSGYSDFSPVFYARGLVFVSDRPKSGTSSKRFAWNGADFLTLYRVNDTAHVIDARLRTPALEHLLSYAAKDRRNADNSTASSNDSRRLAVNPKLNFLPVDNQLSRKMVFPFHVQLNRKYHEGPVCFNRGQDTVYITRNNQVSAGDGHINRLKMYRLVARNGNWVGQEEFRYNSNDYSTGHPALHPDGSVLFFTADMPGGSGGKDLYYCLRTDSGWAAPVNAGPGINTSGDEMFPYFDETGVLYFSSDRWPGLGGLDIFRVRLDAAQRPVQLPENLGAPINSARNDFGIVWYGQGQGAYLSSDRRGNDDIYQYIRRK